MAIRPLGDRILIRPNVEGETKRGSLYIPDTAKERPQEGTVIAVGPGRRSDEGTLVALEVQAGDSVLYGKYAGTEVKVEGEDHMILRESDVLAVLG